MKKAIVLAAVTMMSASAFASKARVSALGNAAHVSDIQDRFSKPHSILGGGEYVTFEFGTARTPTTAATDNQAEGGFVRKHGDTSYGFYLGHKNTTWTSMVTSGSASGNAANTLQNTENPFQFVYAMKLSNMDLGFGLDYASSDKKSTKKKHNYLDLVVSLAQNNAWDVELTLPLIASAKSETAAGLTDETKAKTMYALSGGYNMDTLYFYASIVGSGAKHEVNTGTATVTSMDRDDSTYTLGVVNSHKKDGVDFFYGASYVMTTQKDGVNASSSTTPSLGGTAAAPTEKVETTSLPLIVGIEADATSWLVLRGSITQNFNLIGSTKSTPKGGSADANTIADNTTVAAGAGLKFGKMMIDGTLKSATSSTGSMDGNTLLANASMTYMF